jgi:hypothetical protein
MLGTFDFEGMAMWLSGLELGSSLYRLR